MKLVVMSIQHKENMAKVFPCVKVACMRCPTTSQTSFGGREFGGII